jgi:hypothetical protein
MASKRTNKNQSYISDYLPGFAYYDNLGNKLAEDLVDIVEFVLAISNRIRRYIGNRRQH